MKFPGALGRSIDVHPHATLDRVTPRRLALRVLLASIAISSLLGIVAILGNKLGDTAAHVLLTHHHYDFSDIGGGIETRDPSGNLVQIVNAS